ncbi:4Fe-4S ferredoxin [Sulfurimonas hongkongensis]|uniref:4Fe-4S ferredoxin n=1 Tax=Sulfurimonas hongkongensis TaxID=1172190 RepID=T0JPB8_9BACT|nr:4Fe-4S binding protein [Sulfurimonas hongkongensis]EQB40026.1 4Fe-4S ferredoxin [Sulfurimonas hongkongensis]
MSNLKKKINNMNLVRFRFWFQIVAFLLIVYGGYIGFDLGDKLPTFACVYNSDGTGGKCYLGMLQHDLNHHWETFLGFAGYAFSISLGMFIVWFWLLNKAWCGFVCPLGTMQDWITAFRKKLKIRFSQYDWSSRAKIKSIKWILLILLLIIPVMISNSVFGLPTLPNGLSMPFCDICPGRMLIPAFTGDFGQFYIDFSSKTEIVMTTLGMIIVGLFLVGSFIKKRFFCYFCPMAALQYTFSKPALLKLYKDGSKCTKCGDCYRACDMDILEIADDVTSKNLVTEDCTLCLKCVAACPEEGCLEANFVGKTIFESTKEGFIIRMAMDKKRELNEQH